ncbi:hypothetical protein [Phytohabitans houttuyneae]|uniref:Uncharacterized protein n=1 Tax=Phytohabitans houttuyneae TaxID=1076126 RepID=A0A6V8K2S9_9ACTN|nr:hypothetical protein [Phytohabitans houttuyneae]GFJ76266.1 hypothetical protein Phou_004460 [Phytohabitans houttuyneae]
MNTYLEDLIRDAQQRQAGRAVPPERILAKLPRPAAAQPRRRSRAALMVAAACVLGLVVAAVPLAVHLGAAQPPAAQAAAWSGTVPDFGDLPTPQEVWPAAVHRIPATLPGGGRYTVSAVIGAGKYVVRSDFLPTATTSNDLTVWPVLLDAAAGTARSLNGPAVERLDAGLAEVFVDGGDVLWGLRRDTAPYELWIAPVDGSAPARLLTTWPLAGQAYPIGVDFGVVYWRYDGDGAASAIYRMRLGNLVPQKVDGTEGYQDFGAFPWVTTRRQSDVDAEEAAGGSEQRTGSLLNVLTGERRGWTANDGAASIDCNPTLCLGLDAGGRATVQRLDGTGFREVPFSQRTVPYEKSALAGRFGLGSFAESGGRTWIWDRRTGAAATVPQADLSTTARTPLTVVQWEEGNGARYVLDLAAIT